MQVSNMLSHKGNKVANQFIIEYTFQKLKIAFYIVLLKGNKLCINSTNYRKRYRLILLKVN